MKKSVFWVIPAFLAFFFVGLAYDLFALPYIKPHIGFWQEWCIRYATIYGIGLPLFLLISKKAPNEEPAGQSNISANRFIKYTILALGLSFMGGMQFNVIYSFINGTPLAEIPNYFNGGSFLEALFFLCIIPPVLEELFFRKILLKKINGIGRMPSIFVSALAFSVYHTLLTSNQVLHVFYIGLILAYIYSKTNKIIYVIIIHSIINLYSVFATFVFPNLPQPLNSIIPLLNIVIMISAVVILIKNRSRVIDIMKGK